MKYVVQVFMLKNLFLALKPLKAINILFPLVGYFIANGFTFPISAELVTFSIIFVFYYGALYLLNDLLDVNEDRVDKLKSQRIVASGRLPVTFAWAYCLFLLLVTQSLVLMLFTQKVFFMFNVLTAINLAYPLIFKKIAYIDGLFISITPILKVVLGMLIVNNSFNPLSTFTFMVIGWLTAFAVGMEKKNKELLLGQKRNFFVGKYESNSITFLQYIIFCIVLGILISNRHSVYAWLGLIMVMYYMLILIVKNNRHLRRYLYTLINMFSHGHVSP